LRFDSWNQASPTLTTLSLGIKSQRQVPVSKQLFQAIQNLKNFTTSNKPISNLNPENRDNHCIFFGFNKFGSLGSPISPRGIELLVRLYGPKLGFPELTPRTFRHSAVLHWFEKGIPQAEIQALLGLKTAYAFRSYELLFKSSSETTSISETSQPES
ncbi:MAG: site-specific integrase, partial [Bdellovibrionia bacterium]